MKKKQLTAAEKKERQRRYMQHWRKAHPNYNKQWRKKHPGYDADLKAFRRSNPEYVEHEKRLTLARKQRAD